MPLDQAMRLPPSSPACSSASARSSTPSRPSSCRAAPSAASASPSSSTSSPGPPGPALARHTRNPKVREQLYSMLRPRLAAAAAHRLGACFWSPDSLCSSSASARPSPTPWPTPSALGRLRTDLYVSGTTLFTLGLGDVLPRTLAARALIVIESGTGLGFVALVIGYVPVLYNAFSHREVSVALLDARAGSPPTSTELLRRHAFAGGQEALVVLLIEWERWSAEILESHISYPILCYYRSQHDNQSWLSALTAVLDTCALLISVVPGTASRQAQLTFAMAPPRAGRPRPRLPPGKARGRSGAPAAAPTACRRNTSTCVCDAMHQAGLRLCGDPEAGRPPARPPRPLRAPRPGARRLPRHVPPRMDSRAPRQRPVEDWSKPSAPRPPPSSKKGNPHQRPVRRHPHAVGGIPLVPSPAAFSPIDPQFTASSTDPPSRRTTCRPEQKE